jgi:type VI secretion system protein ImpF
MQSVRLLKATLRRDLEWLLNSRRTPDEAPESSPELQHSLYNYGLPDLSSFTVQSVKDQHRLAWLVESVVAIFEPRLQGVRVNIDPMLEGTRQLRFTIEGLLRMDPAPERVSFDTLLELTSGTYHVKGEPGAR